MKRSTAVLSVLFLFFCAIACPKPANADSHVRIVRLSLVQGDVRFARQFHDDSLTDPKAVWETAPLNLPLREGYVLATGNGRAEVEFENGAMAFLGNNTVVEFYDLTMHDDGRISRLVLRQGTGIFYVNPVTGDYFSVTGGDFTVEATSRTTFRVDNFDDGSTVNVEKGRVAVLRKEDTIPLDKGQSLSVRAGDNGKGEIARAPDLDDFDHWVSGRIDSVVTATNYSNQYVNSPNYTSGFADLYTYGSWYNVPGYGWGWRPFGVGLGWCPFDYGNWYFDQGLGGWGFVGSAPWGWLPYHYGGWLFSPGYGWVWAPSGFGVGGRPVNYRPVTAVWVRSGATMGLVPAHPADVHGKTPVNLSQGIYQLQGTMVGKTLVNGSAEKWSVVKQAPKDALSGGMTTTSSPTRVTRTVLAGNVGARAVTVSQSSSIVYDAKEHRFVNSSSAPNGVANLANHENPARFVNGAKLPTASAVVRNVPPRNDIVPLRTAPPRPAMTPPPLVSGGGGHASAASAVWGGRSSASMPSVHSSTASSGAHPSGGGGSRH
jgi:FecR protein